MFLSLFYLFRTHRLKVSLNEWITLLEGLQKGLHDCTLSGFYVLCRAIVVTSEVDLDRFGPERGAQRRPQMDRHGRLHRLRKLRRAHGRHSGGRRRQLSLRLPDRQRAALPGLAK